MVRRLGDALDLVARRWMPDPFILAAGLTFVVVALGVLLGDAFEVGTTWVGRILVTVGAWKAFIFEPPAPGGGVNKGLLYFAFQMCLMLVTGHALATSPPVARVVRSLATRARTFRQGVVLVAATACGMALVHWGLGLIVGAMIARQVGRQLQARGIAHHYPLIGAAGYTGLMIWGGGLSGSIPLAAAQQANVPLGVTLFSGLNLAISGTLLLLIPTVCGLLIPREPAGWQPYDPTGDEPEPAPGPLPAGRIAVGLGALATVALMLLYPTRQGGGVAIWIYASINALLGGLVVHRLVTLIARFVTAGGGEASPAERLERSELIVVLLCAMALGWLEYEVLLGEFALSFNNLNFTFLFLGLLFQGTPIRYVRAVGEGAAGCAGIILQFPLYFGILGIMVVTGLGGAVSAAMASAAGELVYPVVTYFSAGLVNLFVPSGGGQWIVQGRIILDGAAGFPAVIPKAIMALAYGDAVTNMLQPFWAVPLLAITRLQAREIIGYTAAVMILGGLITVGLLLVL